MYNLPFSQLLSHYERCGHVVRPPQRSQFQRHPSLCKVRLILLHRKRCTNQAYSDFDSQTRDFQYSSWRKAESFEDALLIMVLKGEKNLLPEIKAPSPSASSVTTDLDHLSVSSLSVEDDGMFDLTILQRTLLTKLSPR